ncbi:hypothetical protein BGW36DRAFT_428474 [Talaromyces proteolyticus]|uniref:Uncharacterized protein n=1 Tax=Talaromyces proteolyticus TaxID=1131652 RepID=A0AAD4KTA9_9EURO|nr:uncharacterized protein BGW36DRAFT_428474 [Talaromyces proteolyticus]KAH8696465.1 hypothetical protein BGW36DRAFT_428474 [Talaromyces proteolyticus]
MVFLLSRSRDAFGGCTEASLDDESVCSLPILRERSLPVVGVSLPASESVLRLAIVLDLRMTLRARLRLLHSFGDCRSAGRDTSGRNTIQFLSQFLSRWLAHLFEFMYSCDALDKVRLRSASFLVRRSGETWCLSAVPLSAIPHCRTVQASGKS